MLVEFNFCYLHLKEPGQITSSLILQIPGVLCLHTHNTQLLRDSHGFEPLLFVRAKGAEGPMPSAFTTLYLEMRRQIEPIILSQVNRHLCRWSIVKRACISTPFLPRKKKSSWKCLHLSYKVFWGRALQSDPWKSVRECDQQKLSKVTKSSWWTSWRDLLECLAFSAGSKINICMRKQLWEMLLFEKHLLMEQTFDVEIYT